MKSAESLHETMENIWWHRTQEMNGKPPDQLFHYTNLDALCGIVQHKELWATNIEFLNDYEEFYYGLKLVKQLAKELAKENLGRAELSFLEPFCECNNITFPEQIFITSLSEHPDKLSQWRGYGAKDKSTCIGFQTSKLNVYGQDNPYSTTNLVKVEYDISEQKKLIYEFFSNYLYGIKGLTEEEAMQRHATKYIGLLMLLAKVKNPSWSEENEWRLITSGIEFDENRSPRRRKRFYRTGKGNIIPYVKVKPFSSDFISNITLPQNSSFVRNKFGVINLLEDNEFDSTRIPITSSSIPIIY